MASWLSIAILFGAVVTLIGCNSGSPVGTVSQDKDEQMTVAQIVNNRQTDFRSSEELISALQSSEKEFNENKECRTGLDVSDGPDYGKFEKFHLYLLKKYGYIFLNGKPIMTPERLGIADQQGLSKTLGVFVTNYSQISQTQGSGADSYRFNAWASKSDYVVYWDIAANSRGERRQKNWLGQWYWKNWNMPLSVRAYFVDNYDFDGYYGSAPEVSIVVQRKDEYQNDAEVAARSWAVGAGFSINYPVNILDPNEYSFEINARYNLFDPNYWRHAVNASFPFSLKEFKNKQSIIPAGVFAFHAARANGYEFRLTTKYNVRETVIMPKGL